MKRVFMCRYVVAFFSFAILLQINGCTKTEESPAKKYPITGLWEGTYLTDQINHPTTYVSFAIYPDGTFIRRSKVTNKDEYAYFKGRWEMNGTDFTFRDTTLSYSGGMIIDTGEATFINDGTLNEGTWQDIGGQPYSGTFQNMKRIN